MNIGVKISLSIAVFSLCMCLYYMFKMFAVYRKMEKENDRKR